MYANSSEMNFNWQLCFIYIFKDPRAYGETSSSIIIQPVGTYNTRILYMLSSLDDGHLLNWHIINRRLRILFKIRTFGRNENQFVTFYSEDVKIYGSTQWRYILLLNDLNTIFTG